MVVSAIVLLLIFLPVVVTLLLSIDQVQNYIVHRAADFASEKLESKISIGRIDIDLLSRVHIYDFYVEDPEQDTLLFVDGYACLLESGVDNGNYILLVCAGCEFGDHAAILLMYCL